MKINQKLQSLFMATALGAMFTLSSCDKEDDPPIVPPVVTPTVVGVAQADTTFSILVAAVTRANLVNTLSNTAANFTVFAPTNTAFRNAGITAAVISGYTQGQVDTVLTPILTYHVLGAKVLSTGVPVTDTVKTLNGKNLFASRNANGVFLNGIKVATADVNASNGVVHVIGKILLPPTKTIAQIVSESGTGVAGFSLLLDAVLRAGVGLPPGTPSLATLLSSPGKYTVFAPTNAAFQATATGAAINVSTTAFINALSSTAVAGVLGSHAYRTNIFASDLAAGTVTTPSTLNPATTLTFALSPAATVRITGTATIAGITATDIIATNGVIHVIDKVLQ
jgi:uncharacterized surface protein with fasciclin (FAS1) repeats